MPSRGIQVVARILPWEEGLPFALRGPEMEPMKKIIKKKKNSTPASPPENLPIVVEAAESSTKPQELSHNEISTSNKELVAAATFPLHTELGSSQCVMVKGMFFITAAHCMNWAWTPEWPIPRPGFGTISTKWGELIINVVAIEPVSDVAVLGPNPDASLENAEAYDELLERKISIKVLREAPKSFAPFPVWIRMHTKGWVAGKVTQSGDGTFRYKTEIEIPCGTSGGPIVNDQGELVGVVSHGTTGYKGQFDSEAPLLPHVLPPWVLKLLGERPVSNSGARRTF